MGVVDQVMQMRSQNMSDTEIESALKKQNPRMSPKDIKKAVEHADIKSAVGSNTENPETANEEARPQSPAPDPSPFDEPQDTYTPPQQPYNPPENQQYPQQNYAQGQNYPQQNYPQNYNYDQTQGGYDQNYNQGYGDYYGQSQEPSDTMVEISEQVFDEKSKEMKKKLDSVEEFRALSQAKIDHLSERLKKIEAIIDKLQAAILERIGSYGRDIGSIKKEMSMMQDTFSRVASAPRAKKKRETEKKK